jgi:hypothetical protein
MSKRKAQWTPLYETKLQQLTDGSTVHVRVPLKGKTVISGSQPVELKHDTRADAGADDSLPKTKRPRPDQVSETWQSTRVSLMQQ